MTASAFFLRTLTLVGIVLPRLVRLIVA